MEESLACSEPVQQVAVRARDFCDLIEDCDPVPPSTFAEKSVVLLVRLYEAVVELPDVTPVSETAPEVHVSRANAEVIDQKISEKFGARNLYWTVFNPFELEDPVASTLSDDFADIYKDLKDGLVVFDRGTGHDIVGAVWQRKFDFETYWGRHLVEALRVLHLVICEHRSLVGS